MNIQANGRCNTVCTSRVGDKAIVVVNGKKYVSKGKECDVTVVGEVVYFNGKRAEPVIPWWKRLLKSKSFNVLLLVF